MKRRAETPVELRPDKDFARYATLYGARRREPDAADVAQVIARKHCAGRKGLVDGATMLETLNANPNQNDGHGAANWMRRALLHMSVPCS